MRGATRIPAGCAGGLDISIHAPHAGCDETKDDLSAFASVFQSTHPMRGATIRYGSLPFPPAFQSTHPMRGATVYKVNTTVASGISIHAPHAGCDKLTHAVADFRDDFNPRTPYGVRLRHQSRWYRLRHFNPRTPCGVRPTAVVVSMIIPIFQSTHPMRGATRHRKTILLIYQISIHAPHAGCDVDTTAIYLRLSEISIHAPHAGCDNPSHA